MSKYEVVQANEDQIKELENGSAFTLIGIKADDDNYNAIYEDLLEHDIIANPDALFTFYTWNGALFNRMYGLTGDNAYSDNLSFISIPLSLLTSKAVMFKLNVGARWLDDIVDNDVRREKEKR